MGNTELLVESMAAKIQVLKERLAATEHRGGHSIEACKLDCLMAMLPLLLGGPRAAAIGPAMMAPGAPVPDVSHLHSKIASLEADKVKLEAEKNALEQECNLLKSRCEQLEVTVAAEPPAPDAEALMREISAASLGTEAPTEGAPLQTGVCTQEELDAAVANERKGTLAAVAKAEEVKEECEAALAEITKRNADVVERLKAGGAGGISDAAKEEIAKLEARLQTCIDQTRACLDRMRPVLPGAIETPAPVIAEPAPPAPEAAPEPEGAVIPPPPAVPGAQVTEDDTQFQKDTCNPLNDYERSVRIRPLRKTATKKGEFVPLTGAGFRSIDTIVSGPVVGTGKHDFDDPEKGFSQRTIFENAMETPLLQLKNIYEILRPKIWDDPACQPVRDQYLADVTSAVVMGACYFVAQILSRSAAKPYAQAVRDATPTALQTPCNTALAERIAALSPETEDPQNRGTALLASIVTQFFTWSETAYAADPANAAALHGLFCSILPRTPQYDCVVPADASTRTIWANAWNK